MVSDLLKKYSADAIRWVLLSHHYRTSWDFDENELKDAENNISLVLHTLKNVPKETFSDIKSAGPKSFISLMDDDLNTPDVLKLIVRLSKTSFQQQTIVSFLSTLGFRM